jgi:hypothetical protein
LYPTPLPARLFCSCVLLNRVDPEVKQLSASGA